VAALGTALLLLVLPSAASAQPQPLGTATAGEVAFSFVGRTEQNGPLFVSVGYLSSVAGLDAADLFTGEDPLERSEATARITYFTSARLEERSVNENLFVTSGTGETTFYFLEDGGADYANPNSFRDGTPIATSTSVWHNTVNVQAPDTGIIFADSVDTQVTADRFTIAGEEYVLGQQDERLRLSYVGQGERTDVEAPRASFVYAGQATTLGTGDAAASPAFTEDDDEPTAPAEGAAPTEAEGAGADSPVLLYSALAVAVLALLVAVASLARRRGDAARP
jgi:hypothetical protein